MVAWITVIQQVGGASAAYLGGLLRIGYGSYLQAFMLSGLLCVVAAIMVLFIGAGRQRNEPRAVAAPAR
jgi:sugar phosphate permease